MPKSKNDCVAQGMARRGEGMRKEHPSGLAMGTMEAEGRKGYIWSGIVENLFIGSYSHNFILKLKVES